MCEKCTNAAGTVEPARITSNMGDVLALAFALPMEQRREAVRLAMLKLYETLQEKEQWTVTQDGGDFYIEAPGQDIAHYQYPWPIADDDIESAIHARKWFITCVIPNNVNVTFEEQNDD